MADLQHHHVDVRHTVTQHAARAACDHTINISLAVSSLKHLEVDTLSVSPPAAILEQGVPLDCLDGNAKSFQTYESNVLFALRFMVDTDIVGGNWVRRSACCTCCCCLVSAEHINCYTVC